MVAVACFAGGVSAGWAMRDGRGEPEAPAVVVSVDRPVIAADADDDVTVAAPNVLGLTTDDARQVLLDAGADPASIEIAMVPAAGEAGLVVTQAPPAGVPAPDGFTLGVSERAVAPDLIGKPVDEARDELDQLGVRTQITSRYDPAQPEGIVLEMAPATGEPLEQDATLVVSAPPSSVFVSALAPIESSCSRGTASVNGTDHQESLLCSAQDTGSSREVVYLVDRLVSRFEAVVGQADDSEPGATVRYVVRGDGRVLVEGTVDYGESRPIEADLTDVLRLSLEVNAVDRPDDVNRPTLVFGSAKVIGGPDQITELTSDD